MKQTTEQRREYQQNCKLIVLQKYGGKCICCGEKEVAILTLDHKNNDGNTERKEMCSRQFYYNLRIHPLREDLQVMCFNCQWRKRIYGTDVSTWKDKQKTTDLVARPIRKYTNT